MRRGAAVVALFLGLIAGCTASGDQRENALSAVCDSGTPLVGAAAYEPGPGIHQIAIMTKVSHAVSNGPDIHFEYSHEERGKTDYPNTWYGEMAQIELVACVDHDATADVVGENCRYQEGGPTGPITTLTREQDAVGIRLLAAAGGQLVDEIVVLGPIPPPCPSVIPPGAGRNISGLGVPPKEIEAWLRDYVEQDVGQLTVSTEEFTVPDDANDDLLLSLTIRVTDTKSGAGVPARLIVILYQDNETVETFRGDTDAQGTWVLEFRRSPAAGFVVGPGGGLVRAGLGPGCYAADVIQVKNETYPGWDGSQVVARRKLNTANDCTAK